MLAFEDVVQRFGARTVLDGISLSVERGERVALVGPSGTGKTTIFRLAYGAFAPTAGRVLVDGAEPGRLRGAALREHATLDAPSMAMLEAVMARERMSARSYDRILRVARTIADLAQSERIARDHLAEAIVYRRMP